MTQPFTYRIQFTLTKEYYYGVRYKKNCKTSDLWSTYFTSSKKIKHLIKKYGTDAFTSEIRKIFSTSEEAILWEHRVNRHTKKWDNYFNESDSKHQGSKYSSSGGLTSANQHVGLHNPLRPWLHDPIKLSNIKSARLSNGKKTGSLPWWNNGAENTKSAQCPGPGWSSGMLKKGTYWNNGNIQVVQKEKPGPEWTLGGLSTTVTGRKWWNNGIIQKLVFEVPGPEWEQGLLPGKQKWWNNGINQCRQKDCPGEGWTNGML